MSASGDVEQGRVRELAVRAAACAAAAALVTAASAAVIALTGAGDDARRTLRFGFAGVERTPAEALRIATHNGRLAAATLLCALVAPHLPRTVRAVVSLLLAVVLAVNAAAVGIALGAYGARLAAAVALHLPAELTALSFAGGAYMSAGRRPLRALEFVRVAAVCAALLVIAAALETYGPMRGLP